MKTTKQIIKESEERVKRMAEWIWQLSPHNRHKAVPALQEMIDDILRQTTEIEYMEEEKKIRCRYSKEGVETFGKQMYGYIIGLSKSDCYKVIWDGLKTPQVYDKVFITKDYGVKKEIPPEEKIKEEINMRLFYALGDIEPTSQKMKRAVESIFDLMTKKKNP